MSEQTIRQALGKLQEDPENGEAWTQLEDAATDPKGVGMAAEALLDLLALARREHDARREEEAVAKMLELELLIAEGTPREVELQVELARVLNEVLDDTKRAIPALERLAQLRPDDDRVKAKLAAIRDERTRWPDLLRDLMDAADRMEGKPQAQAAMLYTAAQTAFRYGLEGSDEEIKATRQVIIERLEEAVELAPERKETAWLLERLYRAEAQWQDVARVLTKIALEATERDVRLAAYIRLARTCLRKLQDEMRAQSAYERVLDLAPGHEEATSYLVNLFSRQEQWESLVAVYEDALRGKLRPGKDVEILLQIAMTNWRMRERPDLAEPYFERIRRAEPGHPLVVNFFRGHISQDPEQTTRWVQILNEAQRAMPDGPERATIGTELAKLSEETQGAGKAIEHWRTVSRSDPGNVEARESLKRLYYRTEAWTALVDVVRQQLDRIAANDDARIPVLRELMQLHRDRTKQDTALVPILNQLVQLAPNDVEAVREQVRIYEALNRPRDLVTAQSKLAELETDPAKKADLSRVVARQWLDKFSNVQNAVEAYERVLEAVPDDEEATSKLRDLYGKRRAFKPLFDLLGKVRSRATGVERRDLTVEMAKLAAERLDRGGEAIALYWELLAEDPNASGVLDALEKQADRDKDYPALARVLSHRVEQAESDDTRVKLLEKLGALYESRVKDPQKTIETWLRVLDLRPGYPKALRILREEYLAIGDYDGLTNVYSQQEDWEGLADALTSAADRVEDPATKSLLSWRVATVYVDRIQRPERAARAYDRILHVEPENTKAAAALAPILEAESQWARLPAVYLVLLRGADAADEKVRILRRLRELATGPLNDKAAAFRYATDAYTIAPTDEARADLEHAARAASTWQQYVDALRLRLDSLGAEALDERRRLQGEIARTLGSELGRVDEAVAELRRVVQSDPEDNEAVIALDRVLREARRSDDLRALYQVRLDRAADGLSKVALLVEWAQLEEEAFAEPLRAAEQYRTVLTIDPDDRRALRAVARLELSFGNAEAAVKALEHERDLSTDVSRAEREVELALLYVEKVGRTQDALDASARALELSPHDAGAISVLETLEAMPDHTRASARILEREYAALGEFDKQAGALEKLLLGEADFVLQRALYDRLATVHHEKRNNAGAAFDVVLRAVSAFPVDLELWDRLGDLGAATGRLRAVADAYELSLTNPDRVLPAEVEREICERASALLEDKLNDSDAAIPYLSRILEADPADTTAFKRLKDILISRERWDELQKMYDRAIAATSDNVRKVDMLTDVALVFEDILDDPARAARAHERVLEIEPEHESCNRALDKLYSRMERFSDLAALLTRRVERTEGESRTTLENRLARLYLEKLNDAAAALQFAGAILDRQGDHLDARTIARIVMEKSTGATRVRAAEVLELVYLVRDEARELDEVTSIRLSEGGSSLSTKERIELLRRLAELRDERLSNDAGALQALAELSPLDPADVTVRAKLLEVGRRAGAHGQVAEVLGLSANAAEDITLKGEIFLEQANVYENLLADDVKAEHVYRRVLGLADAPRSILHPALQSLERIYDARSQYPELAEILALEVTHEEDTEPRRKLLGRLGTLREGPLADAQGAIIAWKSRLEADEADTDALDALDRLYGATSQWRDLVGVLRSRERLTDDSDLRRSLLRRSAEVLASSLDDVPAAIDAYRTLLDEFGPDRPVLAALALLYQRSGAHRDLADALEKQLEIASEPSERVVLLSELGGLRMGHLDEIAAGLEAYRDALMLDPSHVPTRTALEGLLTRQDARAEAAALLRPLYESESAGEKLLAVLEIQAEASSDPTERLETLATAVNVAEGALSDPKRAFALAARGLTECAANDGVRAWIDRVERLSAQITDHHRELVELLRRVEPEIVDGEAKLEVTLRIAELARDQLQDRAVARTYFVRALDLRSDEIRALQALETLYEVDGDAPALLEILKRRVETEVDPVQRTALLFKQAALCEGQLSDPRGAIEALEQLLEGDVPLRALHALERLYGLVERWNDVLGLLERQLGLSTKSDDDSGSKPRSDVELRHMIGVVARKHLGDVDRALEEYRAALTLDPAFEPTVLELEAMLEDPDLRARGAEILEPVYLARPDWRKVLQTLEVRLLDAQDPAERRNFLVRIAGMHEDEGEDRLAALTTYARLLAEDPTSEDTWRELERIAKSGSLEKQLLAVYEQELAKITSDDGSTAKLAMRAGELAEKQSEVQVALRLYRRAHAVEPSGRNTFESIDRLLRQLDVADDRIGLYREALDHRFEDPERVSLLRLIAELHRDARKDLDAAVQAFRELLDIDDRDGNALDALEALLSSMERYRDLAELLEKRADTQENPEKAAAFRLKLGTVFDEKLGDASAAVDCYEQIVQVLPTHKGAGEALERMLERPDLKPRVTDILRPLYEGADDWKRLIALSNERLNLANEVSEKTAILRETARLWEDRGNDRERAFAAIRQAWTLDPEDGSLRGEADRLGEVLSDWDGLVVAYEQASASVDEVSRPDLLRGLADLHDDRRDDPRKALETLERLHGLDPDDLGVLERVDRLATLLGDWTTLDRYLARKADAQSEPNEQASSFRRLGALRRDMLDDARRSIDAYERALDIEADSTETLDALLALYESADDDAKLVDLYQRRVDLPGTDDTLRYDLLMRRARRAEVGLKDAKEAIASLQAAVSAKAGDVDAARGLERLYEAEKMWPELLEAMRLRAATVETSDERISLRRRIAELTARELSDASGALDIYRQVLDEASADEGSIAAVRALGDKNEDLRTTAADILEPVLRSAERHDDLVAVLEMRLTAQQDPEDRGRTLRSIASVHEQGRKNTSDARSALLRALDDTPEDRDLRSELGRLAALEEGDAGFRAFADALEKKSGGGFDPELAKELLTTLAKICEEQLKDDARAARALAKATEQAGDQPDLLEGLDRLYGRLKEWQALSEVLGRRIEVAATPVDRADLRRRLALLQIEEFGNKREGLATLRTSLEELPDHVAGREALEVLLDDAQLFDEVAEALEPVYRNNNDHAKLAGLFERRIGKAPARERTRLRLELARVLEERASDPKAAQRQVERALREDPSEYEPFIELERLLPITGEWALASEALQSILDDNSTLGRDVARDLWLKVAGWRVDHLQDPRGAETAYAKALAHDPENLDILKTIEGLQRSPGRERELVATLRRRAILDGSLDEKRILLREAYTLTSSLEDGKLAEEILRELLKDDEANVWGLEELTKARSVAKDWSEVFTLLSRRAELSTNTDEQNQLRHEAAKVAKIELKQLPQAIELYRELLDGSDGGVGDDLAAKELRELYSATKRHDDLGELLARLIDNARTVEGRSALRIELADLQQGALGRAEDAIDILRAVLDEDTGATAAVLKLGDLYQKLGKHEELAELLTTQIERAVESSDVTAELSLRVRLGELYATQLNDPSRAIETYEAVIARDPKHVGGLSALVKIFETRGEREKCADILTRLVEEKTELDGAELALKLANLRGELKDDSAREKALRRSLEQTQSSTTVEGKALAAKVRKLLQNHYQQTSAWAELAGILVVESDVEEAPAAKAALLREAADIHTKKREAPAEAAALLEKATALQPDDRPLLLLLCDALSSSGRGKEASDVLRKIIESFGGKRSKELAVYHHRLAQALHAMGERAAALAEFDLAFKIDPGNIVVLRDLGKLALDTGDFDRAQKTFRALLLQKLDATSGITKAEVFFFLGEISDKQGDKSKAIQMFERAVETDSSLTTARERIAELKAGGATRSASIPPPKKD